MRSKLFFFLLLLPLFCWAETAAVIVPCYYKHFSHLPELLYFLTQQTQLPNEVVVSVSESGNLSEGEKTAVTNVKYPFKVQFLFHNERLYAGENRNKACEKASSDIFITQDADDLPHPKRIEILMKMFQLHPNIQHIVHKYTLAASKLCEENMLKWRTFSIAHIKKHFITDPQQFDPYSGVHNGNIAIRKQVFNKVRWTNKAKGQDVIFNLSVVQAFHKTMIIDIDLLVYRNYLSSWNNRSP